MSPALGDEPSELDGVWQSLGYNLALAVDGDHFELYEITPISRLNADEGDLAKLRRRMGDASLVDNGRRLSVLDPSSIAPITFERAERLPGPDDDTSDAKTDARRMLDIAWHSFNDNYAFFELRGVDWQVQREKWLKNVQPDSSDAELFEALSGMLGSLKDNHVEINAEGFEYSQSSSLLDFPLVRQWREEFDSSENDGDFLSYARSKYRQHVATCAELVANQMTGEVHRGANDMLVWGMLPGGVGYLNVRAMAGYTEDGNAPEIAQLDALDEALDCAMEDLADARAMIVDVRFNGGGWDPAAVRIANHFADRRRPAFSKQARTAAGFTPATTVYVEPDGSRQFTGPTLLLTSPLTASAAEIFTFCMKALPHVQQAGLPTMGIHSDMLVRHLPNGWTFSLSNEVYRFVDGKVYEKVGIPPGIEIPMFTGNDLADGKDQIVQRALQLLGEQATSKAR
jgi:hypothetical protein